MKQALLKLSRSGEAVDAIGIDTWGVDFGLLDQNGHLLGLPVHYRDARTEGMREKVRAIVPDVELFARTGIAYNTFNTLYQLYAMKSEGDPTLESAHDLLFLPDLLGVFLTGKKGHGIHHCLHQPVARSLHAEVGSRTDGEAGHSARIFGEVKLPGEEARGTLLPRSRASAAWRRSRHRRGRTRHGQRRSRRAAREKDFAYISSGTWSLLGAESEKPLCTEGVMKANYTNEGGVDGSIRLLKNIMGLWIIQECKREWDRRGSETSFGELVELSMQAPAFKAIIDVDDPSFLAPGDMPARVQAYCERSGQAVPEGQGRDQPRGLREPGAEVPLGDRAAGGGHAEKAHPGAAHRRRREQEHVAQPLHGGGDPTARDRGAGRGARSSAICWCRRGRWGRSPTCARCGRWWRIPSPRRPACRRRTARPGTRPIRISIAKACGAEARYRPRPTGKAACRALFPKGEAFARRAFTPRFGKCPLCSPAGQALSVSLLPKAQKRREPFRGPGAFAWRTWRDSNPRPAA